MHPAIYFCIETLSMHIILHYNSKKFKLILCLALALNMIEWFSTHRQDALFSLLGLINVLDTVGCKDLLRGGSQILKNIHKLLLVS